MSNPPEKDTNYQIKPPILTVSINRTTVKLHTCITSIGC